MIAIVNAQTDARAQLASLFPDVGPWTIAALGSGIAPTVIPSGDVRDELAAIRGAGLAALLLDFVRRSGAELDSPAQQQLQFAAFHSISRSHAIVEHSIALLDQLAAAEIPSMIIKGPSIATSYANPGLRPFSDVDVLVDPSDFRRAMDIMAESGWTENPASIQPWRFFQYRCREAVNYRLGDIGSVDIHHRPSPWMWTNRLSAQDLFRRTEARDYGGTTLTCLGREDNAILSALQLISDHENPGSKLLAWRDVIELTAADPRAFAQRANSVGLGGVVRALLEGMPNVLRPVDVIRLLDARISHPRRIIALVRAARSGHFLRSHLARLPLPNGIMYIVGTYFPSAGFLRSVYPDAHRRRVTWWRDQARGASA